MPKPQIGGRVPQDLKDDFDDYADEKDITQSDALRQLLRAGLEAEQSDVDGSETGGGSQTLIERLGGLRTAATALVFQLISLILFAAALWLPRPEMLVEALILIVVGTVTLTIAAIVMLVAALARLSLRKEPSPPVPGGAVDE